MNRAGWVAITLGVLGLASCDGTGPGSPEDIVVNPRGPGGPGPLQQGGLPEPSVRPPLGGPIDGLDPAELAAFERGRELFEKRFRPSEGMGPLYNATACSSCHSTPIAGGSSQLYRNFYIALAGIPGTQFSIPGLPSLVIPAFGSGLSFSLEGGRTVIPDMVGPFPVTSAQRNAVPVFGTGLFEFVSNATIIALSDPNDTITPDGISGRYNTDEVGIGRFGVKAQSNNVELFTRGPLMNQMGITTDPFEGSAATVSMAFRQAGSGPNDPTFDFDGVPDPELATADLGDLIAFTRFLAPVGKLEPFSAEANRGQGLFEQIGCTDCHVPSLPSSRGPVEAYTDLLLHDMGSALADGISVGTPQASSISPGTTDSEWRTQPLWGVSLHGPWLHDGRAETLHEAIEMHAGEGQTSRDAYMALPSIRQADIIEFLEHL